MRCGDPKNIEGSSAAIRLVRFTLGSDRTEELASHLQGIDWVVHLAAEKHQASLARPHDLLSSNVNGTYQLLEACVLRGVKKVVFSSSLYAYGRMRGAPMREDETPKPTTLYGVTKLTGEHLLAHFEATHGLPVAVLRYFFVYGPRQFAGMGYKSVIVKTCERLIEGERPIIHGDGEQTLDYIYVDDVIDATTRAIFAETRSDPINVGSGAATSVNRLVRELVAISGRSVEPTHEPPDWTHGSSRVADVTRARDVLGFSAKTSLRDGLSATYRFLSSEARG